jgi:hypothetical protein
LNFKLVYMGWATTKRCARPLFIKIEIIFFKIFHKKNKNPLTKKIKKVLYMHSQHTTLI